MPRGCIIFASLLLAACASEPHTRYRSEDFEPWPVAAEEGMASFYDAGWFGIGEQTASGERFRQWEMTAAHRTLPFGTIVRVTNLRNGRSTIVRITDRGPFVRGRIIDLSKAGARDLGILGTGLAPVRLEVLRRRQSSPVGIAQSTESPTAEPARTGFTTATEERRPVSSLY